MDVIASKYQASVFSELSELKPETELIQKLFNDVVFWNVFPTLVKELSINIEGNININNSITRVPGVVDRIQFISSDSTKKIVILTNRINIEVVNPQAQYKLDLFLMDVKTLIGKILKVINKKISRVALVSSYFNPNNSDFFEKDNPMFSNKTLNLDNFVLNPMDWNLRYSYAKPVSFNDKNDLLNLIVAIGKGMANPSQTITHRCELNIDINTSAKNNMQRFDAEDVNDLYAEMYKINEQIKSNYLIK